MTNEMWSVILIELPSSLCQPLLQEAHCSMHCFLYFPLKISCIEVNVLLFPSLHLGKCEENSFIRERHSSMADFSLQTTATTHRVFRSTVPLLPHYKNRNSYAQPQCTMV